MVGRFENKLGMLFILGKNNGLADPVATGHMDAVDHQILDHRIHGFFVKDKSG